MGFKIHSTSNHTTPPLVEAPCFVEPQVGLALDYVGDAATSQVAYVCMQAGPAVNGKVLAVRVNPSILFEGPADQDQISCGPTGTLSNGLSVAGNNEDETGIVIHEIVINEADATYTALVSFK